MIFLNCFYLHMKNQADMFIKHDLMPYQFTYLSRLLIIELVGFYHLVGLRSWLICCLEIYFGESRSLCWVLLDLLLQIPIYFIYKNHMMSFPFHLLQILALANDDHLIPLIVVKVFLEHHCLYSLNLNYQLSINSSGTYFLTIQRVLMNIITTPSLSFNIDYSSFVLSCLYYNQHFDLMVWFVFLLVSLKVI